MRVLYPLAKRFIAGESLEETVPKARALAAQGFALTLDLLGESVGTRAGAEAAVHEYLLLLQRLQADGLDCNISIKLSQLGLAMDGGLAERHLLRLASEAQRLGGFVRVDMEGSAYTSATLAAITAVHRQVPVVGAVIQCMLRRSRDDIRQLCRDGIRVRLVKGAYREPAALAYQRREEIHAEFLWMARYLLTHGTRPAFGSHDPAILTAIHALCQELGCSVQHCEWQFLYGVRRDLQAQVRAAGWPVRIYVPYGSAWMPYVMRRMRERKENVWFVVKNLFRG